MFLDEARLAARIRHPNVVPDARRRRDRAASSSSSWSTCRASRSRGSCARSRRPRAARSRRASRSRSWPACSTACTPRTRRRTSAGEPLGIVHRDVSPQNVLVGVDGIARVLDFGVAKAAGRMQTTREGQIKGKLAYMAPEQLAGRIESAATDIYAASVVLWEIAHRRRLFEGDNEAIGPREGARRVSFCRRAASSPRLPPALDDVVLRASRARSERALRDRARDGARARASVAVGLARRGRRMGRAHRARHAG